MALYFSRITSDYWVAKNKLAAAAKKVARDMDRRIIADEKLHQFKNEFKDRITELNAIHSRCKPLELEIWKPMGEQIAISISGVFQMELVPVKDYYENTI
jgi:hypothetical protein